MSISLQADSSLPQGYILVNGTAAATVRQDGTIVAPTLSAASIRATSVTFPDNTTINTTSNNNSFKNRIINGGMRIDQRNNGASISVIPGTSSYALDRNGVFNNAGSNTITAQRVVGSSGFQNALRLTGSTSNTGVSWFQRIEANNIFDLADIQVTFSALIWAGANRNVTASVTTPNSFENFTSQSSGPSTTWAVTTTPTRYSFTFIMPSNAVNGAEMVIALGNLLAGETVNITGVQLERGSTATAFDYRPFGTELQLCQRYYWSNPVNWFVSYSPTAGAQFARSWFSFPVQMRIAPVCSTATTGIVNFSSLYVETSASTGINLLLAAVGTGFSQGYYNAGNTFNAEI